MNDRDAFVLDTNVLVDALLFKSSFGRRAFDIVRARGTLVLSTPTYSELVEVLYRPRLRRYIEEEERRAYLGKLGAMAIFVEPGQAIRACRDPKDDKFLELAVASKAVAIITRDIDLIVLDPFQGVRIFEAQAFVEQAKIT